ncbi:MAG: hypothetical protein ACK530_13830 [Alphaproteobacteria bacterium]
MGIWLSINAMPLAFRGRLIARCEARLRCFEAFNISDAIKDTPTEFQKRRPLVQISPTLKGTDA